MPSPVLDALQQWQRNNKSKILLGYGFILFGVLGYSMLRPCIAGKRTGVGYLQERRLLSKRELESIQTSTSLEADLVHRLSAMVDLFMVARSDAHLQFIRLFTIWWFTATWVLGSELLISGFVTRKRLGRLQRLADGQTRNTG